MDRIGIFIVDDHPVVREGLRSFLQLQPDMEVVGDAADGAEAVAKIVELLPDVALVDIFPGYGGNSFPRCPNIGRVWCWGSAG